jgi:predicted GIY-YIG superfamily endonuclease
MTGYVYFLLSVRNRSYCYIGTTTNCTRRRIQEHNSGYGSQSTAPAYRHPFAVMAYICGFDGEKSDLCLHMECQLKLKRDEMKRNGTDVRKWARAGQQVIDMVMSNEGGSQY